MIEDWIKVSDKLPTIEEGKCSSNRIICKMKGDNKLPEYKLMVLKNKNKSYDKSIDKYEFMSLERISTYDIEDVDSWAYIESQDDALDIYDNELALVKLNSLEDIDYLKSNFNVCLVFSDNFIKELLKSDDSMDSLIRNIKESHIKKAIFEEGIEIIPKYLLGSTNVEEVQFPSTLKCIQDSAFEYCYSLKNVVLPEGLEYLGSSAFSFTKITEIKLPKSLKRMGFSVFSDCEYLEKVDLSEYSLNYISNSCFESCISLESIEIPDSVVSINYGAFTNCNLLKDIKFPKSLKYLDTEAFREVKVESIKLPEGLKFLGTRAFACCGSLKDVTIPSSIEYIKECCFSYCKSLEKVHIGKDAKDTIIDVGICDACNNLKELTCGKKLYEGLSNYSEFEDIIKVE